MDDLQRLRYSRHLLLDEWSEDVQERLLASHALVIGAGGLGAPALLYLAAAGVGHLTVMDADALELSNLQRQVIHASQDVGTPKVDSAQRALHRLNPELRIDAVHLAADAQSLPALVAQADVVLDCTDAFAARQLINACCRQAGKPHVFAAALRWEGQLSSFDPRVVASPCYACLFPPQSPPPPAACSLWGVFAPLVGSLGVMQAGEALKLLLSDPLGAGPQPGVLHGQQLLLGRLLMWDARDWRMTELRLARRPDCPVCGARSAQA